MNNNIIVRKAEKTEIEWINSQYDLVDFKHSNFENGFICIVEVDGQRVGLGRLQKIENSTAELGGIFVLDDYRGMKLATKIVSFLLENSKSYSKIYCLPFHHLSDFYKKFGFIEAKNDEPIPCFIKEKNNWCNKTYKDETSLFILEN